MEKLDLSQTNKCSTHNATNGKVTPLAFFVFGIKLVELAMGSEVIRQSFTEQSLAAVSSKSLETVKLTHSDPS